MQGERSHLETFLVAVLRGAAKLLGCNSTTLILINKKTQRLHIRIGAMALSYPVLGKIERVLGSSLHGISLGIEEVRTSLIYRCWAERETFETSTFAELVGDTFPAAVTEQMGQLAGQRRYICVPALGRRRAFGVLLFEKEDRHPFSRQQREVILRYARRIGELLESDPLERPPLKGGAMADEDAILIFDDAGTLVGHQPGSALAAALERPEPPAELAERCRAITAALRTSQEQRCAVTADGGTLTVTPLSLRHERHYHCAVRVAAGRSAELESQLLHLTLGEDTPALFVDASYMVTSANDAAVECFGAGGMGLVGRDVTELFCDGERIRDLLGHRILHPDTPHCEDQAIISRADGALSPARVEALLLADDQQEAVGFLLLTRPIDRDAAPPPMLKERLATMGEMAAQLAHEIRNPLVSIGAALESLAKEPLPPAAQRLVDSVIKEVLRVDLVLKGYLSSPQDVSLAEVRLAEIIDDARGPLQSAKRGEGKRVELVVAPDLAIYGDAEALRQLFFNVLLNALDASPRGGVVRCAAEIGERELTITVDDDGDGLAAEPKECFRAFFTTKDNGTGLGLTVCQKIVGAHGGMMRLRNRPEGGCRAEMIFPLRQRAMERR